MDNVGIQLDAGARDLLRITYLKPLRDAEIEMSSGKRSRFAQLLKSHQLFKCSKEDEVNHPLSKIAARADHSIKKYFNSSTNNENDPIAEAISIIEKIIKELTSINIPQDDAIFTDLEALNKIISSENCEDGKEIINSIKGILDAFTSESSDKEPFVSLSGLELWAILQRLALNIDKNQPSLGLMNLLYIATELILLRKEEYTGLKMAIIEELEAHLHPHYQINTLKYFIENVSTNCQIILTTHSVIIGSSVGISNLIICTSDNVFPMGMDENEDSYTKMDKEDEYFLERFLDATKANLFFAKGVIIVEGDSENLLIPAIAETIGFPLNKYGVSIVNVGSKAWKRYIKIFQRKQDPQMPVKVAVVADGDIPCIEHLKTLNPDVYLYESDNKGPLFETNKDRFIGLLNHNVIPQEITKTKLKNDKQFEQFHKFLRKNKDPIPFEQDNIQVLQNEWTLEYNLAKSCLKDNLLAAMQNANKKTHKPADNPEKEENPYELIKPLVNGNISKAFTAQLLAKDIIDKKEDLKEQIKNDPELEYITKAIEFACGIDTKE